MKKMWQIVEKCKILVKKVRKNDKQVKKGCKKWQISQKSNKPVRKSDKVVEKSEKKWQTSKKKVKKLTNLFKK